MPRAILAIVSACAALAACDRGGDPVDNLQNDQAANLAEAPIEPLNEAEAEALANEAAAAEAVDTNVFGGNAAAD